jgi:hypothetical protein
MFLGLDHEPRSTPTQGVLASSEASPDGTANRRPRRHRSSLVFLRSLTQLPRVAMIGRSTAMGSSNQVPLNSGSRPMKGGRLGSWFLQ